MAVGRNPDIVMVFRREELVDNSKSRRRFRSVVNSRRIHQSVETVVVTQCLRDLKKRTDRTVKRWPVQSFLSWSRGQTSRRADLRS